MSNNWQTTVPLQNGTNITHNYNLSFEIGTSYIANDGTCENENVKQNDGSDDRARNEDTNGKPQGIRHGNNHEMRLDSSSNVTRNLGNPHGIRPANDNIARIPEETLGDEAIEQHVKSNGNPKGISHETWMPMIVDPILENLIHPNVR